MRPSVDISRDWPPEILGRCPEVVRLREALPGLARLDIPVWVSGETGTGKSLFVRHLHRMSSMQGPLVVVSCSAPTAELEIFGWAEGAFAWARRSQEGALARASGGVLYLDDLPSLGLEVQERLLRAFKLGTFAPLGSLTTTKIHCKLACSGHLDLEEEVQRGSLREDLATLISGAPLHCPPLRERGKDIEELARHFLATVARDHGRAAPALTRDHADRLRVHRWSGNMVELRSWIENLVLVGEFPEVLPTAGADLSLADMERLLVADTLRRHGGNRMKAAEALGIGERTLYRKIRKYAL
ncbi:MAG: sigma-54-dependent transcriptional regulator [Planctomycetota bacterium]